MIGPAPLRASSIVLCLEPALWASSCDRELTATLHREQYSSFFAFSSSDSVEGGASFEEAWEVAGGGGGGVGRAGDTEEATGAGGGGGEALGEEEELPVAGRAEGGLEGGGSLPALEEDEEEGKVVEGRKGLRGEKVSTRPVNRSVCGIVLPLAGTAAGPELLPPDSLPAVGSLALDLFSCDLTFLAWRLPL